MKSRIPYVQAALLAREYVTKWTRAGLVERAEVAGSVRRRKAEVGDLEIVAIPKRGPADLRSMPQSDMFHNAPTVSKLAEAIRNDDSLIPLKPGTHEIVAWPVRDDARYLRLLHRQSGIQIDLFLTTPTAWGLIYFIRTGSADFVKRALVEWKRHTNGGRSEGGQLHFACGKVLPTPEEEDVFKALGWAFVPPADRR